MALTEMAPSLRHQDRPSDCLRKPKLGFCAAWLAARALVPPNETEIDAVPERIRRDADEDAPYESEECKAYLGEGKVVDCAEDLGEGAEEEVDCSEEKSGIET
ncbi:hypothetical protein V491_04817 [Pseudogymnoascus sp. VKM F-3775]|nr:hypothetical protein V491_04817 [Pseudogymnoascus sp. VKM F-3775]